MRIQFKALLIGSASAMTFAAPGLAQEARVEEQAPEPGAASAGDIIVTARRVEERLQDVPISITVYNQEQLDNRNITTASQLATYTPSLASNERFGPDKASFAIRGFSMLETTSPTVGVYFADVVAPRAAAGTASGNGAGPGMFFDLQNLQVLKGPQGTLFGRNTTGGAILLVPRKPTDRLEGYVEGSIGNYDLRRVQAVLNVPLAETFRARLGVDRQKRDGFLINRSGIGPRDFGDSNYIAARLSLVGDLTPNLENYVIARYSRSDTNGFMFRLVECDRRFDPTSTSFSPALAANPQFTRQRFFVPPACAQVDRQNARGDGFYDVENIVPNPLNILEEWQISNTTTWRASDTLTIKNIASYGEFREQFHQNIGGENLVLTPGKPFASTLVRNLPGRYAAAQSTFTEELQFQGNTADARLIWQAGAYLEISEPLSGGNTTFSQSALFCTDVNQLLCENAIPGPVGAALGSLGLVQNQISFRNIGLYAQGTYKLTEQFSVTAGIRYTIDRTIGRGGRVAARFATPNNPVGRCTHPALATRVTLNPLECQVGEFVEKSEAPTWVIDLQYKPIEDLMLYAKWARGYRQGGVNPSNIGLEVWKPEKIDTYEVGAKASFRGALTGYFNISAFYNDLTDQQLQATAIGKPGSGIPGARLIVNAGKSRVYGIEVETSVSPFDGLRLDAGYAYLNSKLQDFTPPSLTPDSPFSTILPAIVGGPLPLTPKHRVSATATYTLPLDDSIGDVSVGATFTYTSKQVANDTIPSEFGVLPSSKLVNLNLDWKSVMGTTFDIAAFVTNLTNEEFPVNAAGNWSSNGYESLVTNVPRMYGMRLKYRFGR